MKVNNNIVEDIKARLITLPQAHYENGYREVVCRCPICGDSNKHTNSTHFYIKVDQLENGIPPLFHCKLCNAQGVFDKNYFKDVGITDLDFIIEYSHFLKRNADKNSKNNIYHNNIRHNFIIPPVSKNINISGNKKLCYINTRLGINLTYDDLIKYRIILNLYDALNFNEIKCLSIYRTIADKLNNDFVGFLTANNDFIIMRNINMANGMKRYFNYNIFSSYDNTKKFYTIPTHIDLLSTEKVEINITEGVFDILGVYNHLKYKDDDNKVYCAVCGSGYINTIRFLINQGIINFNINIYSDSDQAIYKYKYIKKQLGPLLEGNEFNLYYNNISKDFGVTKNEIECIKTVL